MSIPRYSAGEISVATRKGNINVDDQYIRVDHAIAAGCLIPVPDGEVCKFNEVDTPHVMFLGQVYDWFSLRKDGTDAKPISGGEPVGVVVAGSTIVQPLCLKKLEDVG